MMKKHRCFVFGMFFGTDGSKYDINIPCPEEHDSFENAKKDQNLAFRFMFSEEKNEPVIIIFDSEMFNIQDKTLMIEDAYKKIYSYDEFFKKGGTINNTTQKTFQEIFPNMEKEKLYYIDNECYSIVSI